MNEVNPTCCCGRVGLQELALMGKKTKYKTVYSHPVSMNKCRERERARASVGVCTSRGNCILVSPFNASLLTPDV